MTNSLGDRIKVYEKNSTQTLIRRMPVIIRVDGRSFSKFTRTQYGRGYHKEFIDTMMTVARHLFKDMQGCTFAYGQSDEISFLLTDYKTIQTECWFGYNLQKMVSIAAARASSKFTAITKWPVEFDARAFNIPFEEVCNYFIWRQQDATRNSIQMAGREKFSHSELNNKTQKDIKDLLINEKGINWNDYPTLRKRGYSLYRSDTEEHKDMGKIFTNTEIPIFSEDRDFIEKRTYIKED